MPYRRLSISVRCLLLLSMVIFSTSCGRHEEGPTSGEAGDFQPPRAVVRKAPPANLSALKAGSIQIVDGENASMRGMAGMGASMNPGETLPELPCLWVIRSIGADDVSVARALEVTAGNVYLQPREGRGTTTFGRLPGDGTLWLLRPFDPALSDDEIFAQFDSVMTWEPWTQIEYPDTAEGLVEMLGSEDLQARMGARGRLRTLEDPRTPELLIAALGDRRVEVRRGVAALMRDQPDARYVEPLIGALRDGDWQVRHEAVNALGKTTDPRIVEPMIAALEDSVGLVRWAAIDVLKDFEDPRIFDPIVRTLHDPRPLRPHVGRRRAGGTRRSARGRAPDRRPERQRDRGRRIGGLRSGPARRPAGDCAAGGAARPSGLAGPRPGERRHREDQGGPQVGSAPGLFFGRS